MTRPRIPHGRMTVNKAQQRWAEVRQAAQKGDPEAMLSAVSRFEGIVDTMFLYWNAAPVHETEGDT